jgi:soluble lytic murein transglycosylase-like protein
MCCALYLLGLLLFKNQRELVDSQLERQVKKESLVAQFGGSQQSLNSLVQASERNLQLIQALHAPRPEKTPYLPKELIAKTARLFNPKLGKREAEALALNILTISKRYQIDPLLMTALISQESAFNENARSPVGAYGYGQLMPETAFYLGVDRTVPTENLEGCAKYLQEHFRRWRHTSDPVPLVLASYNAGPGAVAYYNGVPPYRETRTYIQIITTRYATLKEAEQRQKKSS